MYICVQTKLILDAILYYHQLDTYFLLWNPLLYHYNWALNCNERQCKKCLPAHTIISICYYNFHVIERCSEH